MSNIPIVTSRKPSRLPKPNLGTPAPNNLSQIPKTTIARKGFAKYTNPFECQRQIQKLTETNDALNKDIKKLQEQLKRATDYGLGYATVVQYFDKVLKIDSDIDLPKKCQILEKQVDILLLKEKNSDQRLESIVSEYRNHLQSEHDLKNKLILELEEARVSHSKELEALNDRHKQEVDHLEESRTVLRLELEQKIEGLQSELESKSREYSDLIREHTSICNDFNKLEESITKDKDAKVRYLQDKIAQLQKDVESLNLVLEMRLEKIHTLEKESLLLAEAQTDIGQLRATNKALGQQIESLEAALEHRREQYDKLASDHEKVVEELTRERKERRRMTMKTEQLEYALNESQ